MGNSLLAIEPRNKDTISKDAIRESSVFVQSNRLGRFLRFTVETTLAGCPQPAKICRSASETVSQECILMEPYDGLFIT
jgi:hypothetical protein